MWITEYTMFFKCINSMCSAFIMTGQNPQLSTHYSSVLLNRLLFYSSSFLDKYFYSHYIFWKVKILLLEYVISALFPPLVNTPGAVGSHLCRGARGAVEGSVLVQGHLVVVMRGRESAVHSLPPPTIPAGPRLELTTFRLRVRLSTIRPRLPHELILAVWTVLHYKQTFFVHKIATAPFKDRSQHSW